MGAPRSRRFFPYGPPTRLNRIEKGTFRCKPCGCTEMKVDAQQNVRENKIYCSSCSSINIEFNFGGKDEESYEAD